MTEFFTAERVVETLHRCEASGINTFQGRGDFHRVMYWLELFRREGGQLHWIGQTASEMHDVYQNIRVIAAMGAVGIYHHGTVTDALWKEGRQDEVLNRLKAIRDTGLQVGLGTHMPEVIEYAEEHDWDVDFYMACFYNISRIERESALAGGEFVDLYSSHPMAEADAKSVPFGCRHVSFAAHYAEQILADVAGISPSLVVYDTFAMIGNVAGRALGVPFVNVCAGHDFDPAKAEEYLRKWQAWWDGGSPG